MKLSIEDLIKIAKSKNEDSFTNLEDDVYRFVLAMKIKEGKHVVKNIILYKAYKLWSSKPLTRAAFLIRFSQLFVNHRWNTYRYYKLNYRPIELLNKVDNKKVKLKT